MQQWNLQRAGGSGAWIHDRLKRFYSNLATLAHLYFQEVVAQKGVADERVSVHLNDFRIPRLVGPIEDDTVHGTTVERPVRKEDGVISRVRGVQVSD